MPAPVQPDFFPDGEDLPLFSGQPQPAPGAIFKPQPAIRQGTIFDLRPQFGAAGQPAPLLSTVDSEEARHDADA